MTGTGIKVPAGLDGFERPSKPLVLTPHGVPDDIEQDVDELLREQRGMGAHPRRDEPAEVRGEKNHEAARAVPDAKPGTVDGEQGANPLDGGGGVGKHNILMLCLTMPQLSRAGKESGRLSLAWKGIQLGSVCLRLLLRRMDGLKLGEAGCLILGGVGGGGDAAEDGRKFDAGGLGEVGDGREAGDEVLEQAGNAALGALFAAAPDDDLVDLEIGDAFHLGIDHRGQLIRDEHDDGFAGVAARRSDELAETVRAAFEDRLDAPAFGLLEGHDFLRLRFGGDGFRLVDRDHALAFGLRRDGHLLRRGLRSHDDRVPRDFGRHNLLRVLLLALHFGAGRLRNALRVEGLAFDIGLGHIFSDLRGARGLGLLDPQIGVRLRDLLLRGVLALRRIRLGAGHADGHFLVGHGLPNLGIAFGLRHFDFRVGNRLGGGFLAERLDIARLVGDVLDVDVDQAQADFFQFGADVVGDGDDELVAIGVDFLDPHRRDDLAHLAEDDFLGELRDLRVIESEQTLGGVAHLVRIGRDADGEGRGNADADVLLGKGVVELDVDRHRAQVEKLVVLDDGQDEGRAAVHAARATAFADASVNNQNAVRRAPLVPRQESDECREEQQDHAADESHVNDIHIFSNPRLREFLDQQRLIAMQGDDPHRCPRGKIRAVGVGPDILQASAEGDLDFASARNLTRDPDIHGAAVIDRLGQDRRPIGAKPVKRIHQREVGRANHHAGADAAQRGDARGKAVLFEDCPAKPEAEQHGRDRLERDDGPAAAVASLKIDAAGGTGVPVMADEHAEDGLKDNEAEAQQSDAPKNLGGKPFIVPHREDGGGNTHVTKLTGLSFAGQKES